MSECIVRSFLALDPKFQMVLIISVRYSLLAADRPYVPDYMNKDGFSESKKKCCKFSWPQLALSYRLFFGFIAD